MSCHFSHIDRKNFVRSLVNISPLYGHSEENFQLVEKNVFCNLILLWMMIASNNWEHGNPTLNDYNIWLWSALLMSGHFSRIARKNFAKSLVNISPLYGHSVENFQLVEKNVFCNLIVLWRMTASSTWELGNPTLNDYNLKQGTLKVQYGWPPH